MAELGDIRAALETRLASAPNLPALVAWENVRFSRPSNALWVETETRRTSIRPSARGPNAQLRHDGLFFVRIHQPQANGASASDDLADDIRKHFPLSVDMAAGSVTVRTLYAEVLTPVNDAPWFVTTVVVSWYTYTAQ
ncbi:MAG: phage tail terminator-like protein [Pseudomonadota bacterium]